MSRPWGKHQYRRECSAPGSGDIEAIFLTNNVSDPATLLDPSGKLTVTRTSQSKFRVTVADKWVYIFPSAAYLDAAPAGTRASVTEVAFGSVSDPNGFSVTLVDPAGAPVAETTNKPVQVRIALYNHKGRAA